MVFLPTIITFFILIFFTVRIQSRYGSIRKKILKSINSIDEFLLSSTDDDNKIEDFIGKEFDQGTLLADIIKQWITLQGRLSSFQFLDFERHVENSTTELEVDSGEYSKSFLLFGLLITFVSFAFIFSNFDPNNFHYFVQNQLFGGIAMAFGSTISAILNAGYITYYGSQHNEILTSFRSKTIELLITKVHEHYVTSSQDQALQQMQKRWSTLANLAEESSRTQRGMIEAMRTNMDALNEVINSFVQTSRQNKEIVEQIENKLLAISQQNESIELGAEHLFNSVDAIKSVFQAENNSLSSIKESIESLRTVAQKQQEDHSGRLDTISSNQTQFSENITVLSNQVTNSSSQVSRFLELQENLNNQMIGTLDNIKNQISSNESVLSSQVEQSNEIKNQVISSNQDLIRSIQGISSSLESVHSQAADKQVEAQNQFSESLADIQQQFLNNMLNTTKQFEKLSNKLSSKIRRKKLNNFWLSVKDFFSQDK